MVLKVKNTFEKNRYIKNDDKFKKYILPGKRKNIIKQK